MEHKSIGSFLSALRKANGMTQQDVADRLNVSNKAVSRWERDECAPDITLIPALAEMFGVTCDELLKGERIIHPSQPERGEPRAEKRIRALFNRAISRFRMLMIISLALSAIGLICMFGITYGFGRRIIGFAVMLVFVVAAVVLAAIAVNRMQELQQDNELLDSADPALLDTFNRTLGNASFRAFFIAGTVVAVSLPLGPAAIFYYVISPRMYLLLAATAVTLLLIVVWHGTRGRYIAWVTGQPYTRPERDTVRIRMTLTQLGLTVLAGVLFVVSPYLNTDQGSFGDQLLIILGLGLLAANIVVFIVCVVRRTDRRKTLILPGIRNMLMIAASLVASEMHTVVYSSQNIGYGANQTTSHTRRDIWSPEYLLYALLLAGVLFVVFGLAEVLLKKHRTKTEQEI